VKWGLLKKREEGGGEDLSKMERKTGERESKSLESALS